MNLPRVYRYAEALQQMLAQAEAQASLRRWMEGGAAVVRLDRGSAEAKSQIRACQKSLLVLEIAEIVPLDEEIGAGDKCARLRRGLVREPHEALKLRGQAGDCAAGLADQHIAGGSDIRCLLCRALADAGLRRVT